jgi:hypothetical protein
MGAVVALRSGAAPLKRSFGTGTASDVAGQGEPLQPHPSKSRDLHFVLVCMGVAVVLRAAALLLALNRGWVYTQVDEMLVAAALADGRGFVFDWYGLAGPEPIRGAFFPPAYVFNVYILERVFGSLSAVFVQNALCSLAVCLCLWSLARTAFGPVVARFVLVGSVLYVPFFNRLTHGSPVYFKMFLMCLVVLCLQRGWTQRARAAIGAAGIAAGILALAMPDILLYVALGAGALVGWRAADGSRRLVCAAIFIAATAVVIAPWTWRNWHEFGRFCLVSTNGGLNFYMGHNPETINEVDVGQLPALDRRLNGELARADDFGRDDILYREGWRYVRAQPLRTAANMLARAAMHWTFRPRFLHTSAPPASGRHDTPALYTWSYVASYTLLLVLGAYGVWLQRRRWRELLPVLLTFVYSTLVTMIFVVQTKQRLIKVEPFMMLFAGVAAAALWERARHRAR